MPPKLMFHNNTYIAAMFLRVHGLSLEFPSDEVMTSFLFQKQECRNQLHTILHQFTVIKSTGKHVSLFFKHQSTSRLIFNFCHVISAVQWKVEIKPFLSA